MTTIVSLANLHSHFSIRAFTAPSQLLLCLASLVFATALAQARQGVVDGPPLDNVVITTEQARTKLQALLDVKRFSHSIAIGRIAKDERLVAFTDGFMERNNIDVLTIAYIDSDELWPRVFRNARKRKIANAPSDQLLAGEIMFTPQLDGREITGYTVTLSLHGKQAQEPLLNLSPEELELIASDVSQQQLGDAQFATPAEAQASAVNAMIAALTSLETLSSAPDISEHKSLDSLIKSVLLQMIDDTDKAIESKKDTLESIAVMAKELLNSSGIDPFLMLGASNEYISVGMSKLIAATEIHTDLTEFELLILKIFDRDKEIMKLKLSKAYLQDLLPDGEISKLSFEFVEQLDDADLRKALPKQIENISKFLNKKVLRILDNE